MLLRRFTDFVLRNRFQGMMAAFLLAFIPVIGVGSIIIAAFITLRKGMYEGTIALIAATLPYFLTYFTSTTTETVWLELILLTAVSSINVLTWVFAVLLRRYNNWSVLIEMATLVGVLTVTAMHLFLPDVGMWWSMQFARFDKAIASLSQMVQVNLPPSDVSANLLQSLSFIATGLIAVMLLTYALIHVVVARWWQAAMFNPGGLRKELHQIRLSQSFVLMFLIVMSFLLVRNSFAIDVMPVFIIAFAIAGLSLMHYLFSAFRAGWLGLIVMYIAILALKDKGIVAIAAVGFIDAAFNVRRRVHFIR